MRWRAAAAALVVAAAPGIPLPAAPAPAGPLAATTAAAPFAARGPYTVGVRTFAQPTAGGAGTTPVEVWYPGDARRLPAGAPKASYDLKQWLPADAQRRVGTAIGAVSTTDAYRDLAVRPGGPYPVVVFSHGFGGYRLQSAFLTTHLASWGFVVAAPDHPSRTLAAVLDGSVAFGGSRDVADLRATLALLTAQQKAGPLAGRIDLTHVIASGHSAGANAALKLAASDARVDGVVALSGGAIPMLGGPPDPGKPALYVAGSGDDIVKSSSSEAAWAAASAPKWLAVITGAGHLAFTDVCVVDRETGGLRGVAKRFAISVPALLDRLGTDGCSVPDIATEQAWPAIRQLTGAFAHAVVVGTPPASVTGIDQATVDAIGGPKVRVRAVTAG